MKTFIFVYSIYDLSTLKSYELLFAISYCFTLSPPLHIISTMRATTTAFSCCFCVYGLRCKFDMTISYVETRNGLPIFWACFCIYDYPLCTYIFISKVFFVCVFQCTARKCFSMLPTLATSSTSSCSSPEARHYNLHSKCAKRSAKAHPHFFHPNSLVCHAKSCCFFVSILRSSYPTF